MNSKILPYLTFQKGAVRKHSPYFFPPLLIHKYQAICHNYTHILTKPTKKPILNWAIIFKKINLFYAVK
ncbi:hypothetical protein DRH27_01090 [Candidatus Falkowbacteria bacterium]|nr:MAG: hypothetical protein DRH27_01090 [Candidatus Falkowbacteria bacterium]